MAVAWRVPLWLVLVGLLSWNDTTAPFSLVAIQGPSMLPTMSADGSDLWLIRNYNWRHTLGRWLPWLQLSSANLRQGDLIGVAHPNRNYVSCKRIVGLPGDTVRRYGEYVHLYVAQDPQHFGILPPMESTSSSADRYSWIDPSCSWDPEQQPSSYGKDPFRTLIVPEGHVWVEGDCPGLAMDSRQYGSIPLEWIRGKVVARLWPLWNSSTSTNDNYQRRPHPIPLDEETLRLHNVHRIQTHSLQDNSQ